MIDVSGTFRFVLFSCGNGVSVLWGLRYSGKGFIRGFSQLELCVVQDLRFFSIDESLEKFVVENVPRFLGIISILFLDLKGLSYFWKRYYGS